MRRVLAEEAEAVGALADKMDESFEQALDMMEKCQGRVITCGLGKSGHIARKTSATLASTGTPSLFLHAAEASHGDLGMVTDRDVVLGYSYSGETPDLVSLFPSFHTIGAKTILMTGRPESSGGREADLVLNVAVDKEACPNNLAPTTSTTVMLALSDALAVAVMERRGFGSEDFAKYHPAGALGRRLTLRVRAVMRSGDDLPVAAADEPLMDILQTITRTGAGGACIVDENCALLGFVSDGDVRRHLLESANPLETPGGDLMGTNPLTIQPDLLAVDALEAFQMHAKKIGEMPVVEDGKLVGLLVLKDLLRTGIV
jgi:arabinose-5-phosphate isomerase